MIPTDPNTAVSTLSTLYHSGAWLCLGILVAYLALRWASQHVAWLEVPGRAHIVSIALGAMALLAAPASQGTTPNLAMLISAITGAALLLLPGASKSSRSPQAGSTALGLLLVMAAASAMVASLIVGCATLHTMTGAFATCASADLGAVVKTEEGQLAPLAVAVAEAIEGNDAGLETWLAALGKLVGVDAIDCATVAYESTHPPTPAGSGAATALVVVRPGLSRAKAWIAAQRKAGK